MDKIMYKNNSVQNLLYWCTSNEKSLMIFASQLKIDLFRLANILKNGSEDESDYLFLKSVLNLFVEVTVQMTLEISSVLEDNIGNKLVTRKRLTEGEFIAIEHYQGESQVLSFPGEPNRSNVEFTELLFLRLSGSPLKSGKFDNKVDNQAIYDLTSLSRAYFFSKRMNMDSDSVRYFNENSKTIRSEMKNYRYIVKKWVAYENVTINVIEEGV